MLALNQSFVEQTNKQLNRIKLGYILAIIGISLLLIPIVSIHLGKNLFIAVVLGILIFVKREVKRHYKDNWLTTALYLCGVVFIMDIVQNKVVTFITAKNATEDPLFKWILAMSFTSYAVVILVLIFVSISFSRFFEQVRQFNMMAKYGNLTSYGPTPFKLKPMSIEPSVVYENRNGTKNQFISFIIRALIVIVMYFAIMNIDLLTGIVMIPLGIVLHAIRPSLQLNDEQFKLFAVSWSNFYLQSIFVTSFVLIFLKEIRLGFKRLFKPQKFAFVFGSYGVSLVLFLIISLLFDLFKVDIPQSKNQEFIEQMQKMTPIISVIGTVILAPITEELVFRQGIAELLYRIFNSFTKVPKKAVQDIAVVTAILVSGILFGFIHVMSNGDYIAVIPYVVSGLVYTTVYFWSGRNVTVTICIHMLHNLVSTIITM